MVVNKNEAQSRIQINTLLAQSGWVLDADSEQHNVEVEYRTPIGKPADYVLMDSKGFPLCVLEAKNFDIDPLSAKEQAREYANALECRFIILSNGRDHYFWDIETGNPNTIGEFPQQENLEERKVVFNPHQEKGKVDEIKDDFIALSQMPDYKNKPEYIDENTREEFCSSNKLRFLRKYQHEAVLKIQEGVEEGTERFLLEMATGTGKTLTSSAIIKMFLRNYGVKRVLFLVDRLELETQAQKEFNEVLKNDYTTVIWKENEKNWNNAQIVVSTVQSFISNNKYKRIFKPSDFDLVISDEAHRSLGRKSRRVFEYFVGFKLGLTATPKDYLKSINVAGLTEKDPRELERRMMLDTYTTFGCKSGEPTFRYSLLDGVKDGYLINPFVYDAKTDVTTELLSEKGYIFEDTDEDGNDIEETFTKKDFEKKFFSEETNRMFCETFLSNARKDPYTGEIGKSLIFCVSQKHATKITQILNEYALELYPNKYQSDFAVQVTSSVMGSQQMTIDFANNTLNGFSTSNEYYRTSKTRICVTVGMMTTGYDCTDLLNIAMMRPIYSPSDFIQMKGRGTRKKDFRMDWIDKTQLNESIDPMKQEYALFDFFGNYEYFEKEFDYDQKLKLPAKPSSSGEPPVDIDRPELELAENFSLDPLASLQEITLTNQGMKIDHVYFDRFKETIQNHPELKDLVNLGEVSKIEEYLANKVFDKPEEFFSLKNLEKALQVDRKLSILDILLFGFGFTDRIKTKEEFLIEEFEKFDDQHSPDEEFFRDAKYFFETYLTDREIRENINNQEFARLPGNFRTLMGSIPEGFRSTILSYIQNNVEVEKFA
ncbi:DEAD/DEAH box helicase family protein [Acidimicrobiaceae bacterium]|nr:DEAD/DEAH box helicase family protein [Acidimicrobiaceae bacterium]